jgi:hypothetical protein
MLIYNMYMDNKSTKSNSIATKENQKEQMFDMINKNIDLLKKIGEEIDQHIKENGGDDMKATLEVMEKYQVELEKIVQE